MNDPAAFQGTTPAATGWTLNPELRRYAWLELSLHRLAAVPLVLLALAGIVLVSADHPAEPLAHGALAVFGALTIVWGAMRAYASVTEEVRDRTWDFQRMAALEPWSLAFGKVLGAPLFNWYIGLWCLLVYGVAGVAARLPQVPATLVGAVALALLVHALGVAASALTARSGVGERTRRMGSALMLLFLIYAVPALVMLSLEGNGALAGLDWWFVRNWPPRLFAALSITLFAGWAALAAWRAMARELREPGWWWAWPAFAAYSAFWWAGISAGGQTRPGMQDAVALASLVLSGAAYLGLALDPATPVSWTRWVRSWRTPGLTWDRRVPSWLVHLLLALALAALAMVLAAWLGGAGGRNRVPWLQLGVLPLAALPMALMVLRDAAIVSCFTLTTRVRKPLAMATFYIVVGDLLLPGLFTAMGLPGLAQASFPLWGLATQAFLPTLGMAIHAAIALAVLWWRSRSLREAQG